MQATPQQTAIVNAITDTRDNMAMVARAGCGKTSTIMLCVEAIARAFPQAETAVCAFNKAIANEIGEKLKKAGYDWRKVQAATLHSLGFGLIRAMFRGVNIDDKKVRNLVRSLNDPMADHYATVIEQLVKTAKSEGFGFFGDRQIGDKHAWYTMADHYDINGFDDTSDLDRCVEIAQQVYRMSLSQTDIIDFDDMILFPLVKNIRVRFAKDFLFIDEAQDLSRARQALAKKFVKPHTGRVIIVGDERQAIYGFAGADAEALRNLIASTNAVSYPLSKTFRCPRAVVREAQKYVADIEWTDWAEEGAVDTISELPADLGPGTAILCRNTAPLITEVYSLISKGIAAKVEGRDIGEALMSLMGRWKTNDLDIYLDKLEEYEHREIQKALAKDNESKAQQIEDKCATVRVIAQRCIEKGQPTVAAMKAAVEDLFGDDVKGCVVLATYHRSKGREWPRVILLQHDSFCPSKWAKQQWQLDQEDNLAYVAITRAEKELYYYG